MEGDDKTISPIEWDRNSEDSMDAFEIKADVKEIQRLCTPHSPPPETTFRLPNKIKYLFTDAKYFLIKSNNYENVSLAKVRNVWSTIRSNEVKLNNAYYDCKNVLLIFSVKESGKFQGYARLSSPSNPNKQINWVLPSHMSQRQLSGVFEIDWLSREEVMFTKTNHLVNAWNDHKPVKIGRDGQEIEPSCGEFLCRLFVLDNDCPFNEIIAKSKSGPSVISDYENNSLSSYNNSNNHQTSRGFESRSNNHNSHNNYQDSSRSMQNYQSQRNNYSYKRSPSSHSKRKKEQYSRSPRSSERCRSDVFLNGNYEDYLREQTNNINRIYSATSYEERVDNFLRAIMSKKPIKRREYSSDYSGEESVAPSHSTDSSSHGRSKRHYRNDSPPPKRQESRSSRRVLKYRSRSRSYGDVGDRRYITKRPSTELNSKVGVSGSSHYRSRNYDDHRSHYNRHSSPKSRSNRRH